MTELNGIRAARTPPPPTPRGTWAGRAGWITAAAAVAIIAVNAAGVWGIAVARRGALEEADRFFRMETAGRARSIESALSSIRADSAFMVASPAFQRIEAELASKDPREARWRRLAVEGALLLFLRGHPEVRTAVVRASDGAPLVVSVRRGGVPILWMPSRFEVLGQTAAGPEGRFEISGSTAPGEPAPWLEATLDAAGLLAHGRAAAERSQPYCVLLDASNATMAAEEGRSAPQAGARWDDTVEAHAPVRADGWSPPTPWSLNCARPHAPLVAMLEPIAERYRLTIMLNLAVMALAILLGGFAIQQSRRRRLLEEGAREQARIRELERQLFHAERLSTAGRLAAGMAHEINNPLEGISNYLRLAREDLERGDAASARRRLDGVREGLDRAAGIVRQVLAHADPASPRREPLDLNQVIAQAAEFVGRRREFAGIRFHLYLSHGLPVVLANQVTLGQVFLNLILNACEAQPGGGEVIVTTKHEGRNVVARIEDRGPGVPEADLTRVFEPFFTTKQSTGLGLSICHAIVRQHEGELTADHREGGGAVFRVVLPAHGPAARERDLKGALPHAG